MGRRSPQECRLVVVGPNLVNPTAAIKSATAFAWIDGDLAALLRPGQHQRQDLPRVICLPPGACASLSRHAMNTPRVRRSVSAANGKSPRSLSMRLIC